MKRTLTITAAVLAAALAGAPAHASECPLDMKKIDAALDGSHGLNATDLAKVKLMRAEGEAHHKAGRHADSVKVLREAMGMLGID